jgi:lysophospholipase L1-like esterase
MAKSEKLADLYAAAAGKLGIGFVDAAPYVGIQKVDGVHWDVEAHRSFGNAVAESVAEILKLEIRKTMKKGLRDFT